MKAFIYCADVYCEACGEDIRRRLTEEGKAPAEPDDECTYDSDDFPKGPYKDGGGKSDSPQHCGSGEDCLNPTVIDGEKYGCFLENELTEEGKRYVTDELNDDPGPVVKFWAEHYDISVVEEEDEDEDYDDEHEAH